MQDILDFYRHTIIHVINYNLMIIIHDRFANACRSFRRFMYIIHIDTTDRYRFGSTPISFVYVVVGHLRKIPVAIQSVLCMDSRD